MGLKILDKHKLEKKLKEEKKTGKKIGYEVDKLNKSVQDKYVQIGKLVFENDLQVDNEEIEELKREILQEIQKIEQLSTEKDISDKSVYSLEEGLRNLDGKIGCPNCGKIFDKSKELMFCSKCGTKL